MKIVVLAGGYSPEREVSLTSGSLIANALMQNGHRVLLLDVYEGIRELPDDVDRLFLEGGCYTHSVSEEVPDLEALRARCQNGDALIGANVLRLCAMADKVFLALHGSMGENGQLQATLDSHGISYTGSGYAGSMLAMDKDISKRLFRDAGVPTPDWVWFDLRSGNREMLLERIGLPCVVKPCDCGSSVGVSMVDTEEELAHFAEDEVELTLITDALLDTDDTDATDDTDEAPVPVEVPVSDETSAPVEAEAEGVADTAADTDN